MMVMHEADRVIRMTLPPEVQQTTHQAVTAASRRSVLTALSYPPVVDDDTAVLPEHRDMAYGRPASLSAGPGRSPVDEDRDVEPRWCT